MISSFRVKNSTVTLNGIDISGVGNTLEVVVKGDIQELPGSRLAGKVQTTVKHKGFFKSSDIEGLETLCGVPPSKSYIFNRGNLEYELSKVDIFLHKHECIAGVVPVELSIIGEDKPKRRRINNLSQRGN